MAQQQKVALRFGRERVYLALTQRQPVCPVITPIAKVLTRVNGRGRDMLGPYWLTFQFRSRAGHKQPRRTRQQATYEIPVGNGACIPGLVVMQMRPPVRRRCPGVSLGTARDPLSVSDDFRTCAGV